MKKLEAHGISKNYKDVAALKPTDMTIEPGKIYGLIGRNGAGKTTLLSVLTAQSAATSGSVTYGGEQVWENQAALGELCFSREINTMLNLGQNTYKGKHYLQMAKFYYPHWDESYAKRLISDFGFDIKKPMHKLSKGMLSMMTITLALASCAPVTMLDEPVAGLDVAMRDHFYRLLLDDYRKTGRTFIISTHIIEEAAKLFEELILIDKGTVIEKGNTEEFLAGFRYVSGSEAAVNEAVRGMEVVHREGIGRQLVACVRGNCAHLAENAASLDVELSAVPLEKAFIYVTGGEREADLL